MTLMGTDITLLRPLWLLAPPLLLWLAFRLRAAGNLGDWRRAVDPHLLAALERRGAVVHAAGRRGLSPWLAAAVLIGAALAGPAMQRPDAGTFRNLDGLVLALDTSRSMTVSGALRDARLAARQVAEAAGSRQVALVLYAGDAYLAAPFSADREALRPLLASDAADLVPDAGSAAARAIAFSQSQFERAGMLAGDVVVVTDGGGVDPAALQAAGKLRAEGRRLHVMFVRPVRDSSDSLVSSSISSDSLVAAEELSRNLAKAGGGTFATALDPAQVVAAIAESSGYRLGASPYAALVWSDFGRYALMLAACPLLLAFRRRT